MLNPVYTERRGANRLRLQKAQASAVHTKCLQTKAESGPPSGLQTWVLSEPSSGLQTRAAT